ncbi:hypothetical protein DFH09DRAFT_1446502 [Mycena vulgaris]|nr:hypothetical protein DFH09DRAFT_1446502 [Mycena vulgaris]
MVKVEWLDPESNGALQQQQAWGTGLSGGLFVIEPVTSLSGCSIRNAAFPTTHADPEEEKPAPAWEQAPKEEDEEEPAKDYAPAPALGIVVAKPTQRSLMYCSEVCAAPALHRDALRHPRANQPHLDGRPALPYTRAALDAPLGGACLHTKRARARTRDDKARRLRIPASTSLAGIGIQRIDLAWCIRELESSGLRREPVERHAYHPNLKSGSKWTLQEVASIYNMWAETSSFKSKPTSPTMPVPSVE